MARKKSKKTYKPFSDTFSNTGCGNSANDSLNTSSDLSLGSETSTSRNNDSSIDSSVIQQRKKNIATENIKSGNDSDEYKDISISEIPLPSTGTKKKNTSRGHASNSKNDREFSAGKDVGISNVRRNQKYQQSQPIYHNNSHKNDEQRWWNSDDSANSQNANNSKVKGQGGVGAHIIADNVSGTTDIIDSWDDCAEDNYDANGDNGLNVNAQTFVPNPTQPNCSKTDTINAEIQHEQGIKTIKYPERWIQDDSPCRNSETQPGQGIKYPERWIQNDSPMDYRNEKSRGRGRFDFNQSIPKCKEKLCQFDTKKTDIGKYSDSNTRITEDDFPENRPQKHQQKLNVDREGKRWSLEQEKGNTSQNWRNSDDRDNRNYSKRSSEGSRYGTKEQTGFNTSFSDPRVTRQNRESFDRYSETTDKEYKRFREEQRRKMEVVFKRVNEIQQDLFAMPKEYSLAHCVAEDMRMGSGIAVSFKRDFKDVDILFSQRQKQGGVAILEHDGRYIYYLVTKRVSTGKPTYDTMWSSLKKMRDHIKDNNVEKLAIPRLGCGLDRLEWDVVKYMIEFLFRDVDVEITVCNFQQSEDSPEKPQYHTCKIVNVSKPVADIEEETSIIYLSTEDGHISTEMEELNNKFPFLYEFKRSRKEIGSVVKYKVPNKYYVLNGCIVRKNKAAPFDFEGFRKCIQQVSKDCRKEKYCYIAIQAINDASDDLLNEKIITLLKTYVSNSVHVYVCWDGDLVSLMPDKGDRS